jgi:hypothetical protein
MSIFGNPGAPRTREGLESAEKDLFARGKTWQVDGLPFSERLWTMFLNPGLMHECNDNLEPDRIRIADQARSRSTAAIGSITRGPLARRLPN